MRVYTYVGKDADGRHIGKVDISCLEIFVSGNPSKDHISRVAYALAKKAGIVIPINHFYHPDSDAICVFGEINPCFVE
jgi:hypothetical protein